MLANPANPIQKAYWANGVMLSFGQTDSPNGVTGTVTFCRLDSDEWVVDGKSSGTGNPNFGSMFLTSGYLTDAGGGNMAFKGEYGSNFVAGTITMIVEH